MMRVRVKIGICGLHFVSWLFLVIPILLLKFYYIMIMVMITFEIQYSSTALLLLVNPRILHRNNGTTCPTYILNFIVLKENASLPAMFNPLCSSTNLKKNFCNQSSLITDDFRYEWKPSRAYHKINTFHGEKRWTGHKGGYWYISPWRMCCMYSDMAKGTSQAESMLNSEKI